MPSARRATRHCGRRHTCRHYGSLSPASPQPVKQLGQRVQAVTPTKNSVFLTAPCAEWLAQTARHRWASAPFTHAVPRAPRSTTSKSPWPTARFGEIQTLDMAGLAVAEHRAGCTLGVAVRAQALSCRFVAPSRVLSGAPSETRRAWRDTSSWRPQGPVVRALRGP